LLLLIIAVSAGGLVWFDYLGLIDIKTKFAPVYQYIGLPARTQPVVNTKTAVPLDLNDERYAVLVEADALKRQQLDKQQEDIAKQRKELQQMAAELETRQKGLDEREKTMSATADLDKKHAAKIEENARYLNGMDPTKAVPILLAMNDQDAIAVMKKTDELATAAGSTSIVSYWFSLMPPARAADIQRKMAEQP
jgi:flagellar protein FlbB